MSAVNAAGPDTLTINAVVKAAGKRIEQAAEKAGRADPSVRAKDPFFGVRPREIIKS